MYQTLKGEEIKETDFTETKKCPRCRITKPDLMFGELSICTKCVERDKEKQEKAKSTYKYCKICANVLTIDNFTKTKSGRPSTFCNSCKAKEYSRPVPCNAKDGMSYREIWAKQMKTDKHLAHVTEVYYPRMNQSIHNQI